MDTHGNSAAPATRDDMALARAVLAAAGTVDGVAGVSQGRYAMARTFGLGGDVVEGVHLAHLADGLAVEVHLVTLLVPLRPLADHVRAAVAAALARPDEPVVRVDVYIDALSQ